MSSRRRPAVIVGVAVLLLVLVVAFVASRSSSNRAGSADAGSAPTTAAGGAAPTTAAATSTPAAGDPSAPGTPSTSPPPSSAPDASGPAAPDATAPAPAPTAPPSTPAVTAAPDAPRTPVSLPVAVTVSSLSGLRDGQEVKVHAVPTGGSQVFGVEARICAAGRTIDFDADFKPTQTGNCIVRPLSSGSDHHVTVAAAPPYQAVDVAFRVGVGTSTYTTQSGDPVAITCGPGNPCQLVLKLQIPNGFGFQSYPLNYG